MNKADPHNKALRWSRRLSFVPRWTVMPAIRRQTVDAHCFHVAQTCLWLLEYSPLGLDRKARLEVLELALRHDTDEASTGDAPAPSKGKKLASDMSPIQILVKVADVLEAMAFITEEIAMGNNHGMYEVMTDLQQRLHPYWEAFEWGGTKKPTDREIMREYLEQIVPTKGIRHPILEPQ